MIERSGIPYRDIVESVTRQEGLLNRAILFATNMHAGQFRKAPVGMPQRPYIVHPLDVMTRLMRAGVEYEVILAAAVLHDVLEDTDETEAELEAVFGREVTALVVEVSDPEGLSKTQARKRQVQKAPSMSGPAKLIKLADKTSNLHDIVMYPPGWKPESVQGYAKSAAEVVEALGGVAVHSQLFFEFEQAFEAVARLDGLSWARAQRAVACLCEGCLGCDFNSQGSCTRRRENDVAKICGPCYREHTK